MRGKSDRKEGGRREGGTEREREVEEEDQKKCGKQKEEK